ncbi:MAG: hypothetical protein QOH13_1384 [Thermoleophilaceae bacterium]|nr:hypothetical protein [Thermoleophilaceae bacterium]
MRQGIALLFALVVLGMTASSASAAFGIDSFNADVFAPDGTTPVTQAGATPHTGVTEFTLAHDMVTGTTQEQADQIRVDLPPGLISNPEATPKCSQTDFGNGSCPANTQIGKVDLKAAMLNVANTPVYNLVPDPGHVSDFGFAAAGILTTHVIGGVRDTGDYGLFFTIDVTQVPLVGTNLYYSKLTFFGDPGDPGWATGATHAPFIRLPTACVGDQTTTLTVHTAEGNTYKRDSVTNTNGAHGCDQVPFAPSVSVTPDTTKRDSPVGVAVGVHVPWETDPTKLASSHVKDTVVVLPPGMAISPSAANGLQACTDDQFGQGTHNAIACPAASKVGTASIVSPNLSGPLTGSVYLGAPQADNPYRLFVVVDGFGLSIRLKGKVTPDPVTGQLTTTFADTPQVPFTDFTLNLGGGPSATLASPLACGPAATTSSITPYSGNAPATPGSSYTVDLDGAGGACPPTPFTLGFSAGSQNMGAGAFSPFSLNVTRDDGQQFLSGLTVRQPAGLLGVIQSVPLCDEAHAAAGTCPDESRVGTSTVSSGPGSTPFSLSGPVYLSGPTGDAPFGLVIAIRALAGPFDLGTVVVRAGIKVDPTDSHLTIDTPSLPTILQGIPLRLRTVTVAIDRAGFLFNPTNCDALAVGATLKSSDGATQDVSSPFQATGCDALPYAPKMTATTQAAARGKPAGLTVNLSQAPGEANTRSVSVHLPTSLAARLDTVQLACPLATFQADPTTCGPGSKVGTVTASTPLLAAPLAGTVYLELHEKGKLPTLEAVLQGSGITVDLSGTIALGNGITSTFATVPDVPITSFRLALPAGPGSVLAASADLCSAPLGFTASILGQNGKKADVKSVVGIAGCKVQILKTKVSRRTATLSVRAPGPGTLTLTGKGITKVKKTVKAGGTYKIRVKLSKAGVKALKKARKARAKRKRKLTVKVKVAYAPKKGAVAGESPVKASSTSRKVTFKGP